MTSDIFDFKKVLKNKTFAYNYYAKDAFLHIHLLKDIFDRLGFIIQDFPHILCINISPFMWEKSGGKAFSKKHNIHTIDHISYLPKSLYRGIAHKAITSETLPIEANQYDLIICPLSLHIFNDLPLILKQLFFSLKADGIMIGNIIGDHFLGAIHKIFAEAELSITDRMYHRIHPAINIQSLGELFYS